MKWATSVYTAAIVYFECVWRYLEIIFCVVVLMKYFRFSTPPTHILFTERGVCLPTVSLWILFVYIEAAIRFKDLKNFHVDLCRPFAAHW